MSASFSCSLLKRLSLSSAHSLTPALLMLAMASLTKGPKTKLQAGLVSQSPRIPRNKLLT